MAGRGKRAGEGLLVVSVGWGEMDSKEMETVEMDLDQESRLTIQFPRRYEPCRVRSDVRLTPGAGMALLRIPPTSLVSLCFASWAPLRLVSGQPAMGGWGQKECLTIWLLHLAW